MSTLYTGRVGDGGDDVTHAHHNFVTILAVDEALANPSASPLSLTMFDAIDEDEDEGDSEVTTQTLANHENDAASAEEEQIHAGESMASPHRTPACSFNVNLKPWLPFPLW